MTFILPREDRTHRAKDVDLRTPEKLEVDRDHTARADGFLRLEGSEYCLRVGEDVFWAGQLVEVRAGQHFKASRRRGLVLRSDHKTIVFFPFV